MTTVTKTLLHIVSTGADYTIPGDWSIARVVSGYADSIPGLASFQASEVTEDDGEGGQQRVITFSPRTGNKG